MSEKPQVPSSAVYQHQCVCTPELGTSGYLKFLYNENAFLHFINVNLTFGRLI